MRLATKEEASLIHEITQEAFEELRGKLNPPSGAHEETLQEVITSISKGGAVLAQSDGRLAGCARFEFRDDYLYIGRVGVLPSMRRKGVASSMLEFVEQFARNQGYNTVQLGTREVLQDNVRLYQGRGYEITYCGPHPKGGDNVVEMTKRL